MSKVLMIQGTMSGAGKSLITAGLCRVFHRRGYRVAPFKSQNMALNSFITGKGLEMGRAQVMQAEAAGMEPDADMNPILLKPTNDTGSQVIVNGRAIGDMSAREYFQYKRKLIPDIQAAFRRLEQKADLIIVEGAGSPAEINLRENDIVNMGLAEMLGAPVLLTGDIDRGGVFAQLYGTAALLQPQERARIAGLIINKFRGDKSILDPGIREIEQRTGIRVLGVIPYLDLHLEDEDSLSPRLERHMDSKNLIIDVIRFPRISNFTDMNIFDEFPDVCVRYVTEPEELQSPDLVILPGSKNTIADLRWFRTGNLARKVISLASEGVPVIGICGGFQMLGESIEDPLRVETAPGESPTEQGLGLLPVRTCMQAEKTTCQVRGALPSMEGFFRPLGGLEYEGYEIHMGRTTPTAGSRYTAHDGQASDRPGSVATKQPDALPLRFMQNGNVLGGYVHGIFDRKEIAQTLVGMLRKNHPGAAETASDTVLDYRDYKQQQYDLLADTLEQYMEIDTIESLLKEAAI